MDLIFFKKKEKIKRKYILHVYKFWDYKKSGPYKNFFPPFFFCETIILIPIVYHVSTIDPQVSCEHYWSHKYKKISIVSPFVN